MLILKKKIISILSNIFDPEIPINIYELGLIYDLRIRNKNIIRIILL
ncbi:MAG: iron-sulfur cluster assembly protein [Candidatus Karelsulcia muelleri]